MVHKSPKKKERKQAAAVADKAVAEEEAGQEGPLFFHKEWEAFGFLSNYSPAPFSAPDPAFVRPWPGVKDDGRAPVEAGSAADAPSIAFHHSEQYYMYCKAVCFGDRAAAQRILAAQKPGDCKDAARAIKGFQDRVWDGAKVRAMEDGLWYKFGGAQLERELHGQDNAAAWMGRDEKVARLSDLGRRLLATGERRLIEAAGRDRFWGIGYGIKQQPLNYEKSWGKNQLGKSLMATRARLRALVEGGDEPVDENVANS